MASLSTFGQDLSEYRWKNRLVILVGTESNPEQLKLLKNTEKQLQERDILVLEKTPNNRDLKPLGIRVWTQGPDLPTSLFFKNIL